MASQAYIATDSTPCSSTELFGHPSQQKAMLSQRQEQLLRREIAAGILHKNTCTIVGTLESVWNFIGHGGRVTCTTNRSALQMSSKNLIRKLCIFVAFLSQWYNCAHL